MFFLLLLLLLLLLAIGFQAIDTGNCNPRYIRMTTSAPAISRKLQHDSGIPLGLVCTPFATPENGEETVPYVQFQDLPPRCTRCNGYINCSVSWLQDGNAWQCNLCNMINTTPSWYFSSLDGGNVRLDRNSRPELCKGSYDILAPPDYSTRPLQQPIFVFILDITEMAIESGLTLSSIQAIRNSVSELYFLNNPETRVGILTFNSCIQFYQMITKPPLKTVVTTTTTNKNATNTNMNNPNNTNNNNNNTNDDNNTYSPNNNNPERSNTKLIQLYILEPDDPTPVLPDSLWILPLIQYKSVLEAQLDRITELLPNNNNQDSNSNSGIDNLSNHGRYDNTAIPPPLPTVASSNNNNNNIMRNKLLSPTKKTSLHRTTSTNSLFYKDSRACPTAAIKVVQLALTTIGGHIYLFTCNNPTTGYGKSKLREQIRLYGTDDELSLYGNIQKYADKDFQFMNTAILGLDNASNSINNSGMFSGLTGGSSSSSSSSSASSSTNSNSTNNISKPLPKSMSSKEREQSDKNLFNVYIELAHVCNINHIGMYDVITVNTFVYFCYY